MTQFRSLILPFVGILLGSASALLAEEPVPAISSVQAIVSVADQKIAVLRDGQVIAKYPISTSRFGLGDRAGSYKTPVGKLRVCEKLGDRLPEGAVIKHRRATGEVLSVNAPGRDPIVTRILWLDGEEAQNSNAKGRGIYIHGTPEEKLIGKPASYGCIRMRSKDVVALYEDLNVGSSIAIIPEKLPRLQNAPSPKQLAKQAAEAARLAAAQAAKEEAARLAAAEKAAKAAREEAEREEEIRIAAVKREQKEAEKAARIAKVEAPEAGDEEEDTRVASLRTPPATKVAVASKASAPSRETEAEVERAVKAETARIAKAEKETPAKSSKVASLSREKKVEIASTTASEKREEPVLADATESPLKNYKLASVTNSKRSTDRASQAAVPAPRLAVASAAQGKKSPDEVPASKPVATQSSEPKRETKIAAAKLAAASKADLVAKPAAVASAPVVRRATARKPAEPKPIVVNNPVDPERLAFIRHHEATLAAGRSPSEPSSSSSDLSHRMKTSILDAGLEGR